MAVGKASFQFRLEGIGNLISDRFFAVPTYQRSYSWGDDHVVEYWHDVNEALQEGKSEYFLGTIVLTDTNDRSLSSVIDGQQRISTTIILFSALRHFLIKEGENNDAEYIKNHFVAASSFGTSEDRPRIHMNTDDNPFFQSFISGENAYDDTRESHRRIRAAFEYFSFQVEQLKAESPATWKERINSLVSFIEQSVQVVVVDVPDEADAFLIFETLNDRGADLTTADLLKNYLFGKSGSELDVVRDRWVSAVSFIQTVADDQAFTPFLRHLWSSMNGITRERELYAKIKGRVTDKKSAVHFAENLSSEARNYAAIISPNHERWDELGTIPKENLQTLIRLDLEQIRPLLLALVQHFDAKALREALAYLVSWNFRSLTTGSAGGGVFESAYCQASVKVRSGQIKNVQTLFPELASIIPTDVAFEGAMKTATISRAKLARYVLHSIERFRSGRKAPEMISNNDEEAVNLEHILPKNAKSEEWKAFGDDDRALYVHRLGNMALLDAGKNRRIGNKPWVAKRPIMASSSLGLAQSAAVYDDWNASAIEAVQEKMAADAVKIWARQPI